eukprot:s642_g7.t2
MARTDPCNFTVVLVGILGAGKSSTGNLLLAKDIESGSFRTGRGLQSVTTSCSAADCLVEGDFGTARLRVIDMPGLDDPGKGAEGMMAVFREVQEHAPNGRTVWTSSFWQKLLKLLMELRTSGAADPRVDMRRSLADAETWLRQSRDRSMLLPEPWRGFALDSIQDASIRAQEDLERQVEQQKRMLRQRLYVLMQTGILTVSLWIVLGTKLGTEAVHGNSTWSQLLAQIGRYGLLVSSVIMLSASSVGLARSSGLYLAQALLSVRLDRQCIVPEVSRCYPYGPPQSMDDPSLRRSDRTAFDDFMRPVLWNKEGEEAELGELDRMKDRAYEKLFLEAWPNDEGLAHSRPVASFRDLLDLETGTHHIILDEQSSGWAKAAHFLRLPERMEKDQTIPGSYQNVLRLRWGGAVLYVVFKGSKLLSAAGIRSNVSGFQDIPRQRPVLLAGVASVVVSRLGASCAATCSELETGARCHDPDLIFLNACSALRHFMGHEACGECIAGDGQEYPSVVLFDTQLSGSAPHFNAKVRNKLFFEEHSPPVGTCLWNANLAYPPRCDAAHRRLARLCMCRAAATNLPVQAADLSKPSARPIVRNLVPEFKQVMTSYPLDVAPSNANVGSGGCVLATGTLRRCLRQPAGCGLPCKQILVLLGRYVVRCKQAALCQPRPRVPCGELTVKLLWCRVDTPAGHFRPELTCRSLTGSLRVTCRDRGLSGDIQ